MRLALSCAVALLACLACAPGVGRERNGAPPAATGAAKRFDPRVPPTRKEILQALLACRDLELAADSSCIGVGTDFGDRTIGDYVSGFLAEFSDGPGRSWIETTAEPAELAPPSKPAWQCRAILRHVDGDDRWGWGVAFRILARDHSLVAGSIRCIGAG